MADTLSSSRIRPPKEEKKEKDKGIDTDPFGRGEGKSRAELERQERADSTKRMKAFIGAAAADEVKSLRKLVNDRNLPGHVRRQAGRRIGRVGVLLETRLRNVDAKSHFAERRIQDRQRSMSRSVENNVARLERGFLRDPAVDAETARQRAIAVMRARLASNPVATDFFEQRISSGTPFIDRPFGGDASRLVSRQPAAQRERVQQDALEDLQMSARKKRLAQIKVFAPDLPQVAADEILQGRRRTAFNEMVGAPGFIPVDRNAPAQGRGLERALSPLELGPEGRRRPEPVLSLQQAQGFASQGISSPEIFDAFLSDFNEFDFKSDLSSPS